MSDETKRLRKSLKRCRTTAESGLKSKSYDAKVKALAGIIDRCNRALKEKNHET